MIFKNLFFIIYKSIYQENGCIVITIFITSIKLTFYYSELVSHENYLKVHRPSPQMKLKSKLLIGLSLNFTHIKIVSMRQLILNFKSISQI